MAGPGLWLEEQDLVAEQVAPQVLGEEERVHTNPVEASVPVDGERL